MKNDSETQARGARRRNPARLGQLAVLATAVALAAPAVAQGANEVTKWNEIAVNTVNAQPPITSAPPTGAVFVAMVQGAVYGAVNAADRHGKPYLIERSFPKASANAAAATAAFREGRRARARHAHWCEPVALVQRRPAAR